MMGGDWNSGWAVLVIGAMIAMMAGMGWMMFSMMRGGDHGDQQPLSPIDQLATRYARGELTTDEYQERLAVLKESHTP